MPRSNPTFLPVAPRPPVTENALTVDVEEWFHICGVPELEDPKAWPDLPSRLSQDLHRLLDLFDSHGARGTFFFLGWLARRYPNLVRLVGDAGHEVACHGFYHRPVHLLDDKVFSEDLEQALQILRSLSGAEVNGFRAPQWSLGLKSTPRAFEILAGQEIQYDSSLIRAPLLGHRRHPASIVLLQLDNGSSLIEAPPLSSRLAGIPGIFCSGSWPLRLFGAGRALKATRNMNRSGFPAVFFLHPWELDPDPPRVRLPLVKQMVHYAGLDRAREVWNSLLRDLTFRPLGELLSDMQPAISDESG